MLLCAVSVSVVAQSSSKIPEGLMNNSVFKFQFMAFTNFLKMFYCKCKKILCAAASN